MSAEYDKAMLSAALLWLLNHYEAGTGDNKQLKAKIILRIEDVLHHYGGEISISDMMAFRKSFRSWRPDRAQKGESENGD